MKDAGFTLIELMVAMAIFSVFLVLMLSSVISITRASTKVQVTAQTSSAVLSAFSSLDHQIRYADSINWPGVGTSGDTYVEFDTPATSTASLIPLCTQWRFDPTAHVLQSRSWNNVTGAIPGSWQTNLTNVATGGANYPFQLLPATLTGSSQQELVLTLATGNTATPGASIVSTFVARNSSIQSPSNADDNVVGTSDSPICPAGSRP